MEKKIERFINIVQDYLSSNAVVKLQRFLNKLHTADVADVISHLEAEEGQKILNMLKPEVTAEVLNEVDSVLAKKLVQAMSPIRLSKMLDTMPPDNAADILQYLPEGEHLKVLAQMTEEEAAEEVAELIQYDKDTAGGIMTTEFVSFHEDATVADTLEYLRKDMDVEAGYYIYTTDREDHLRGVVTLKKLIMADPDKRLKNVMISDIISVKPDSDQEYVANLVAKYDLLAVPVTDASNRLLGIITVDDIIDVIREEATEDVYKSVGTTEDELLTKSSFNVAKIRLPWLITTLLGGLICVLVVSRFKFVLEQVIALAFFMPIIAAMGGNIGIQSSTIVVRGLATGIIDTKKVWKMLFREVRIGAIMGLACGAVVGTVGVLWQRQLVLGLVLFVSMFMAIIVAAAIGAIIPLVFNKFNIDPAIATGPFVTTANDITGMLIYFSLALGLMKYLV
ncbi:MAG: magnesium transporter [bacterium]|nr:magnesium transporter [bacterium]